MSKINTWTIDQIYTDKSINKYSIKGSGGCPFYTDGYTCSSGYYTDYDNSIVRTTNNDGKICILYGDRRPLDLTCGVGCGRSSS